MACVLNSPFSLAVPTIGRKKLTTWHMLPQSYSFDFFKACAIDSLLVVDLAQNQFPPGSFAVAANVPRKYGTCWAGCQSSNPPSLPLLSAQCSTAPLLVYTSQRAQRYTVDQSEHMHHRRLSGWFLGARASTYGVVSDSNAVLKRTP